MIKDIAYFLFKFYFAKKVEPLTINLGDSNAEQEACRALFSRCSESINVEIAKYRSEKSMVAVLSHRRASRRRRRSASRSSLRINLDICFSSTSFSVSLSRSSPLERQSNLYRSHKRRWANFIFSRRQRSSTRDLAASESAPQERRDGLAMIFVRMRQSDVLISIHVRFKLVIDRKMEYFKHTKIYLIQHLICTNISKK